MSSFSGPPSAIAINISSASRYSPLENRIFDYFRSRIAPCFSGHIPDSVWDRTVLQLSDNEPAVRHAIHAVGALLEGRKSTDNNIEAYPQRAISRQAAAAYCKAIAGLQAILERRDVSIDIILVCALLLIQFEALRECFAAVLLHCDSAIRLLTERTGSKDCRVGSDIVQALTQIDLQATYYLGLRPPKLAFFKRPLDDSLPLTIRDLGHARDLVCIWGSRLFHFLRTVADDRKFRVPGDVKLDVGCYSSSQAARTLLTAQNILGTCLGARPDADLHQSRQALVGLYAQAAYQTHYEGTIRPCDATSADKGSSDCCGMLSLLRSNYV